MLRKALCTASAILFLLGTAGGAVARAPLTGVGVAVDAELEIERILAKGDMAKVRDYFTNGQKPGNHRARALRAYYSAKKTPLGQEDGKILGDQLIDIEAPVRMASAQMVGDLKEQALSRQVLELAANDRDQNVRLVALMAVRPWTRLTHLFFLEGALGAKSEVVQAEAIRSISLLSVREVQPALVDRIQSMLSSSHPPIVRRAALDAMKVWGRADWEMLRQIIADTDSPESLRAYAVEISDSVPEAVLERTPTLIDIVMRETSINLGWWAFRRLKSVARNDRAFIQGLSRLLGSTTQYNTATAEMASFLRSSGIRAEFKQGGWKVGTR